MRIIRIIRIFRTRMANPIAHTFSSRQLSVHQRISAHFHHISSFSTLLFFKCASNSKKLTSWQSVVQFWSLKVWMHFPCSWLHSQTVECVPHHTSVHFSKEETVGVILPWLQVISAYDMPLYWLTHRQGYLQEDFIISKNSKPTYKCSKGANICAICKGRHP